MIVRFNDPNEFLADLERDQSAVVRNIVRLTQQTSPRLNGTIHALTVVGTAKVESGENAFDLLRLDVYIGDLWNGPTDAEVRGRGTALLRDIEEKLAGAGFQLGAGIYEEVAA